jgi:hypothetical protein
LSQAALFGPPQLADPVAGLIGPTQVTVGLASETVPDVGVAVKAIGTTNNANIPATLHKAINASRIRSFAELGAALAKLCDMKILLR